jgi:hypothetical protein
MTLDQPTAGPYTSSHRSIALETGIGDELGICCFGKSGEKGHTQGEDGETNHRAGRPEKKQSDEEKVCRVG